MLTLQSEPKPASAQVREGVPPLQNGDQLHSREFLRRYDRMPLVKKAELIEGVVIMGSPVSIRHARPDNLIHVWLGTYAAHTPGTEALDNVTVILDPENTVQPDSLLRLLPALAPHLRRSRCWSPDHCPGPRPRCRWPSPPSRRRPG